jgi:biotin/methionine sulfoxide reductase
VDWGTPVSLCRHGNPNVLMRDVGASQLSQGCTAQSCLVELRKAIDPPPATAFALPDLAG